MNAKKWKRRGFGAVAVASGMTVFSNIGYGQTVPIVNQTFDEVGYAFHDLEAGYTNVGAYLLPPAGNNQLLSWYTGGGTNDFSFVADPAINSGNALDLPGANGKTTSGAFPTNAVLGSGVGDAVTLSFTFVIPNPGSTNSGSDFRFGLFNNNGTPMTAPFSAGYTATNDDYGYSADLGIGTNFTTVWSETNVGSGILNYDLNYDYRLASTPTGPNITDELAHTVLMTMTNAGSGQVNVALAVDGTTYFSGLDTNPTPTTTFNEIAIWDHSNLDYRIDNVQVDEITPVTTLTWDNAGGASPNDGQTWDIGNSNNWNSGVATTVYTDGVNVTFDDNNNENYAVTLSTIVHPGAVLVNNSAGNYTISGTGSIAGTASLTKTGSGTLALNTVNSYTGGTTVNGGTLVAGVSGALPANGPVTISTGTVQLAQGSGLQTLSSLSIASGASLDINNNVIIINYGSGPDPITSIASWIASGYANGAWTGTGIMSTAAQTNGASYGIGYSDALSPGNPAGLSSGQIEIMYTLLGDANLDGKVNGTDFTLMAANFNDSVTDGWGQGDFNYDGSVNGEDFVLLADNFNQFASQSAVSAADLAALDSFAAANGINLASVPEPTVACLLAGGAMITLGRRRRTGRT